jgi:hypothetical protein
MMWFADIVFDSPIGQKDRDQLDGRDHDEHRQCIHFIVLCHRGGVHSSNILFHIQLSKGRIIISLHSPCGDLQPASQHSSLRYTPRFHLSKRIRSQNLYLTCTGMVTRTSKIYSMNSKASLRRSAIFILSKHKLKFELQR